MSAQKERVKGRLNVTAQGEIGLRHAKERAAKNSHGVRPNRQARKHHHHGDINFGVTRKWMGSMAMVLQGVDFLP